MEANTIAEKIVAEFEEALTADGKAAETLESYVGDIRAFLQWLDSKGNIFTGNLKRFHVTNCRNYLVKENYEVNTINKKINSLQSFNQFLSAKGKALNQHYRKNNFSSRTYLRKYR